jgi:hypothetical protein
MRKPVGHHEVVGSHTLREHALVALREHVERFLVVRRDDGDAGHAGSLPRLG